ncbi:AraC family transcriptional regulator [Dyella caseinilytica]|uniref:Helix-turn-helix transcriptional regulator n=1 Tax=Dyella caseinilytica TaxID=1849581 RepID=A0ABX7GXL0_9GAMM|nr:helix-turn-helix transcriptional regulator [Dyella caseinilytica]QRN55191.1 helix-turn-helix transcriptional regulator [Dyella caseinilytica]GFZ99981.1 transcriptional regulator [Dyella caseinilytica]
MTRATPPRLDHDDRALHTLQRKHPRGTFVEPHAHEWAQVLYAIEGVMWVEVGQEALVVPPQRAVWLPAGLPHSIRMMSAVQMRNLYLQPQVVTSLSPRGEVFEVSPMLRQLIVTMTEEGDLRSDDYRDAAYRLIVLELLAAKHNSLRIALPNGADRRLGSVCQAVIDNPSQDISLEQHAERAGASVRTISRLFTQELGVGFAEWRRQVQLAVATSRLAEGHAINAIARSLGYQPSSFSDMFRRELGMPPVAYKSADDNDRSTDP